MMNDIYDNDRPLMSFCLFAYNQERYIRDAVLGAFAQTYSPLEIILSDDCSPDRTFEIMKKLAEEYKGPHKIILNRNENNLGLVPHFNKVMFDLAKGELLVCAAGDDISLPERSARSYELFRQYPKSESLSFNTYPADEKFTLKDLPASEPQPTGTPESFTLKRYFSTLKNPGNGCARTFRRRLLEEFGPIPGVSPSEDMVLAFRACMLGENLYSPEKMVYYRKHGNNISSALESDLCMKYHRCLAVIQDANTAVNKNVLSKSEKEKLESFFADLLLVDALRFKIFGKDGKRHYGRGKCAIIRAHFTQIYALTIMPIRWSIKFYLVRKYFSPSFMFHGLFCKRKGSSDRSEL